MSSMSPGATCGMLLPYAAKASGGYSPRNIGSYHMRRLRASKPTDFSTENVAARAASMSRGVAVFG